MYATPAYVNPHRPLSHDLSVASCKPGDILFLKPKEDVTDDDLEESGLTADALNHPAVVVKASKRHAVICLVSIHHNSVRKQKLKITI